MLIRPAPAQVGGHNAVAHLPGLDRVAKPLDSNGREAEFYEAAPVALAPFLPL